MISRFFVGHSLLAIRYMMNNTSTNGISSAAIIVIGDEILKGQTLDTNSHFLCQNLYKIGVRVDQIHVIHDDINTISKYVRECSGKFDHVLTSGGIGPTHDDVTVIGVAQAFDEPLEINNELKSIISEWFKEDKRRDSAMKMASLPKSARLVWGHPKSNFPLITVKNVYCMPGIPSLLKNAFRLFKETIGESRHFFQDQIFLTCDEISMAPILNRIAADFTDKVNIGSYPKLVHSYYRVKVTVDSLDRDKGEDCIATLRSELKDYLISYDSSPMENCVEKFDSFLNQLLTSNIEADKILAGLIQESVKVVEQVLAKYEPKQVCVSFNGGKDCTALLHLIYVTALRLGKQAACANAIYFRPTAPFEDTEHFITDTKRRYGISVVTINGAVKSGLEQLKMTHSDLFVVFLGSRNSDHRAQNDFIAPTDPDWPSFLRVAPILHWKYSHVWRFLRGLYIPYCHLYDQGYTSMGCKDRTEKNEELKYINDRGTISYKPAYMLKDETLERKGRM